MKLNVGGIDAILLSLLVWHWLAGCHGGTVGAWIGVAAFGYLGAIGLVSSLRAIWLQYLCDEEAARLNDIADFRVHDCPASAGRRQPARATAGKAGGEQIAAGPALPSRAFLRRRRCQGARAASGCHRLRRSSTPPALLMASSSGRVKQAVAGSDLMIAAEPCRSGEIVRIGAFVQAAPP